MKILSYVSPTTISRVLITCGCLSESNMLTSLSAVGG
eukprot:CAMPEP_0174744834 /NCGR_PEP_ID=MMETSP1094-20130205/85432_1 /TAXON_ID=156173 /ORGANISM="Chrysochromulina brevifilum, Strain UTEX LB 985" /LENGTH=36 /DNA_ID= /DNA_START= /DNA_END= /DNA_ORIENTATION=